MYSCLCYIVNIDCLHSLLRHWMQLDYFIVTTSDSFENFRVNVIVIQMISKCVGGVC